MYFLAVKLKFFMCDVQLTVSKSLNLVKLYKRKKLTGNGQYCEHFIDNRRWSKERHDDAEELPEHPPPTHQGHQHREKHEHCDQDVGHGQVVYKHDRYRV